MLKNHLDLATKSHCDLQGAVSVEHGSRNHIRGTERNKQEVGKEKVPLCGDKQNK